MSSKSPAATTAAHRTAAIQPCTMSGCWTSSSRLMLAAVLAAGLLATQVAGHGQLTIPASRNWLRRQDNSLPSPLAWTPNSGNGRSAAERPGQILQPGVCGDPWQGVNPSTQAQWVNFYASLTNQPIQATYAPGSTVRLTWQITANHLGRVGFKICNRNTYLDQACFDQNPLQRADGLGRWTYLPGPAGGSLEMSQEYVIPNIACNGACILQWEYYTYNSCWGGCDNPAACPSNYLTNTNNLPICFQGMDPERFHNCADILITGSPRATCSGSPPNPANGMFSCGTSTAAGSSCTARCNSGYAGSPTAVCGSNGAWGAVSGQCSVVSPVTCANSPPNPANGVFSCATTTVPGGSCTARCNSGYTGSPTAVCGSTGTWGSVVGQCSPVGGGCSSTAAFGGACGNGVCCPSGQCCSQWGWCGTTTSHCGTGCQRSWGSCTASTTVTAAATGRPSRRPPRKARAGGSDAVAAASVAAPAEATTAASAIPSANATTVDSASAPASPDTEPVITAATETAAVDVAASSSPADVAPEPTAAAVTDTNEATPSVMSAVSAAADLAAPMDPATTGAPEGSATAGN